MHTHRKQTFDYVADRKVIKRQNDMLYVEINIVGRSAGKPVKAEAVSVEYRDENMIDGVKESIYLVDPSNKFVAYVERVRDSLIDRYYRIRVSKPKSVNAREDVTYKPELYPTSWSTTIGSAKGIMGMERLSLRQRKSRSFIGKLGKLPVKASVKQRGVNIYYDVIELFGPYRIK